MRPSEVHRAAAGMEPESYLSSGLNFDLEEISCAAGEDVVVVGRGRAAGEGQSRESGAGCGVLDLLVYERPHRVEFHQPLEEGRLRGEPAGGPLVEVVVAVHEPRRGQAPAPVDAMSILGSVLLRRLAASDGRDLAPLDRQVTGVVLVAGDGGDGGDGAVLDNEARGVHAELILFAARRTASRIFSYPVQRQRLPASASLISASVGRGLRSSRSWVATTSPGVQNPHCTPPASTKASCTGCKSLPSAMPSTVTTSRPSAWPAITRQEQTSTPSR